MAEKRGQLIVIEGADCSGKSTQIKLLVEKLQKDGLEIAVLDFPNYSTPTGKIVRRYLDNEFGPANEVDARIASIFFAQDRHASKHIIEKALKENDAVILDRYVESNMGHQGGKIKETEKRKEFYKWLEELEYGNFQLPKPDFILFLHMPYLASVELRKDKIRKSSFHPGKEDGHESNPEHLKNAEQAYLQLADLYSWTKISCCTDSTIATLRTPENISEEVYTKVRNLLDAKKFLS